MIVVDNFNLECRGARELALVPELLVENGAGLINLVVFTFVEDYVTSCNFKVGIRLTANVTRGQVFGLHHIQIHYTFAFSFKFLLDFMVERLGANKMGNLLDIQIHVL
jgi:hypothetical protein